MQKKILFILPTLRPGGAERIVLFIAREINKDLFEPKLLVIGKPSPVDFDYDDVDCVFLNKSRTATATYAVYRFIKSFDPDIIFTSIGQLNMFSGFLSILMPHKKFVAREASVNSIIQGHRGLKSKLVTTFSKLCYKRLDIIICQSEDMANDVSKLFKLDLSKIRVINNPITIPMSIHTERKSGLTHEKKLITIGRLSKEKGFDRLLKVLSSANFKFQYTIIGNGNLKDKIFALIDDYNLENSVNYLEYTSDVKKYLLDADLFLQGSYVEGFPNALLESCACGTPVVAFNAPGGTKEIIEDGLNGFIVNEEDEFAEKLYFSLYEKQWNRDEIREFVYRKFGKQMILGKYENLFLSLIK